jgi:iron complex outermembrane receptor protein
MIRSAVVFLMAAVALPLAAQTPATPPPANLYAQYLVDTTATRHPELLQLDLHATPPGSAESVIIASKDAARLGHKSDRDDVEVFKTGTPRVEINRSGDQNVETEVQFFDVNRRTLGTVEMTFPYVAGLDEDALIKKAVSIRDELSRRILDEASLFEPTQLDAQVPSSSYAQFLVDDTLARHPEVEVVALHARAPQGGADYPIVASNIGRIGKPADASDLEVIKTGISHTAVDAQGARVESKVVLQDASGNAIGALAVIFPYRKIQNEAALQRQAEKIRDELRERISNVASLYEPRSVTHVAEAARPIEEYNKAELGNKQTLPMTKAVVSGKALEESSQDGYAEAVRNVAGVAPANSKGSPNDSIYIRGIKLNLFSNYRLNGGLPIAGVITLPNEDKERVETLKGANALMFGVASPAGIINLVTKRALDHDVNTLGLAGNSFGQYGATFDLGRRFGPEKQVGLRVNASATHLENGVHDMGGHGDFESAGADWRVNDRLSFQGDLEHYSKHIPEQAGISLASAVNGVIPITPVPNPRNLLSGTWNIYSPKTTNLDGRVDYIIADGWKVLAEAGRSDAERSRGTVRIGSYNLATGAGGVVTVQPVTNIYINKFYRSELLGKFATGFLSHDLTIGVSSSERNTNTYNQNNVTLPQKQNIFDPIVLLPPVFTKPFTSLPLATSRDNGVYGYDTVGVTPEWKVLLGLRQTWDKELNGKTSSTSIVKTPAYGMLYDIRPTTTLFASYMEGLEAGATSPATAANPDVILPPAISRQKEIGIRDSYIKGLSISGSFFEITRANAVTDPVTHIFENNGNIEYKGVESTMSYDIDRQWTVNGAIQWLSALQNAPLQPLINGLVPENTPKWLGNLSVTYRVQQISGLTLTAGTTAAAKRPVNPQDQGYIPGYALYTVSAGYVTRIAGRRVALQLNVDNVANKRYWNSVQTGTYGTGMDRAVKMNAKVDF